MNVVAFPTPKQREVLRQLDGLAAEFQLTAEQRTRAKARYLETEASGRSTAVAVGEARAEIHQRPARSNRGPSAA